MILTKRPKVLIVDDEPGARKLLAYVLENDYDIGMAKNTEDALEKYEIFKPDIVISDVKMPGPSGLVLAEKLHELNPDLPIILVTGHGEKSTVISALQKGVFDFLEKPCASEEIKASVARAVAHCYLHRLDQQLFEHYRKLKTDVSKEIVPKSNLDLIKIFVIGAGIGGPEALTDILVELPLNIPPILVALQIPEGFSERITNRLNKICPFEVRVAKSGDTLEPGLVLIAPGGMQTLVVKRDSKYIVKVAESKSATLPRPCLNEVFSSLAECAEGNAVGVLLTGMGEDGATGLKALRASGAHTIVQSIESCVVAEMVANAVELEAAEKSLNPKEIAKFIISPFDLN